MTLVERIETAQALWTMAMPTIPVPPSQTFVTWLMIYDDSLMEIGIARTAEKMRWKSDNKIEIEETDAARYCTSIMRHKTEQQERTQR